MPELRSQTLTHLLLLHLDKGTRHGRRRRPYLLRFGFDQGPLRVRPGPAPASVTRPAASGGGRDAGPRPAGHAAPEAGAAAAGTRTSRQAYPGGQVMVRPPSTWQCTCGTVWLASGPVLNTSR
ncbi:hypothetical protein Athai_13090 [Actinocatenispora thailandica]|uniref:Uncharacterized protein n=1 Tax=Actinocatenispora thailandica TaxID=227318 RepID=A0A7R7DLK2_9ACTN|nr:hypothetical protein Athai_13090 [Actinocatenispora thailandica]